MSQPGIEIWQVVVVAAFLAALLALRWALTRSAPQLRAQLRKGQRVVHIESQSLGPHARISLFEVDEARLVVVHGRGHGPAMMALEGKGPAALARASERGADATAPQ